jgi:type IV fimbrial biogenesis protein FimT
MVDTMEHRFIRARNLGVTLIELVVVMTIIGVLLAIGIPSYRYVTNANRIAAEINGLLGDLQFARGEAIKEGQTVSACISSSGTGCVGTGATGWQVGWIVFSDVNGNGALDPGDTILRVQPVFSATDTLIDTVNATSSITFNREGFAPGVAAGTLLTLHSSPKSNGSTRCLSITIVGLMAVQTYGGACT